MLITSEELQDSYRSVGVKYAQYGLGLNFAGIPGATEQVVERLYTLLAPAQGGRRPP